MSLSWHRHEAKDANGTYYTYVEPGCSNCQKKFERSEHVCGKCGQPVSNKVFLSGDYHFTGKCIAKFKDGPPIPERTVDKPFRTSVVNMGHVDYYKICGCGMDYQSDHSKCGYEHLQPPFDESELSKWWFAPRRSTNKTRKRGKAA